ncbi:sensor histidine kinase [Hyphomicrobium facile]|uniref:sensor histidine kinase n=1 Tax=Hyphomicrobium facile TaxID=51670 RepID=UPI0015A71977|nr:sensor histidine kinase [Hyphomicrobium facile]
MNADPSGRAGRHRQAKFLGQLIIFPRLSLRAVAYLVCLGFLIPTLGLAAYLLSAVHSEELTALQADARTRALLAASSVDDQMDTLLRTLKALPAEALTQNSQSHIRTELDRKGIVLFKRSEKLDVLSPVGGLDSGRITLDDASRSAAVAALSKQAPQIAVYDDAQDKGIDVWLAAASSDAKPVLIQARVPSAFLASPLKKFAAGGPWSISVVGPDGQILARTRAKSGSAPSLDKANRASLVEAVADTSQFGWKVAAQIPEKAVKLRAERNWITFVTLSSLLAAASFAGATWLTRNILEDPNARNLPPAGGKSGETAGQPAGMSLQFNSQDKPPHQRAPDGAREQLLRQALRAGNVGVWEWNLATGNIHWDAEIADIFNDLQPAYDYPARTLIRRVDRNDRRRLLKAIGDVIAGSKPLALEVRVSRRHNETRWIAVRGAPAETDGMEVKTLVGVAYDVTDQKLSLTRTDALLREVSHRSKNLLALILAMARLTARDAVDVKSHLKDFTLRVAGLAASQDLIVASDWQNVDLATLATAEIGAVARTDADRVAIMGPPVMLTPEAAQTLGMVLTELALNAVEHGALSTATGKVRLSWSFPDPATILISWRETSGPPFVADGPKGYGMSVVERFSTQGLKLSAHAVGNADEFTWTLTGPLVNIGHAPKSSGQV